MARLRIVALCAVVAIVVAMMPAAATTSLAATGVGDPLPDVESLTTPFSRVVRNADGTFTASLSAGPARVRQPDGSWAEIDLHLERTEHGFSPRVGWTPVTVFADSSEGVGSIGTPSGRVVVGVEGSASVDGTMVPGEDIDVVQFSGALGTGTEIEAHATTNGLKTSYTVPDANAASVIERVTYPAGWSARQGGGYVALYDAQGQHVASWAGGTATDSTGLTAPVRMDLIDADGGMARASAAVDEAWLARAAYPVTIDPLVFVVAYAGNDSWLNSQFPTNTIGTYKGWTEMHVGRRDAASAIGRAFLIYDIARYIPANATVVSADLRLYEFASLNNACYYSTINVRRASTPWDDQTNWLTQPVGDGTNQGVRTGTFCPGSYIFTSITPYVQGWQSGLTPNFGVVVVAPDETSGSQWKKFRTNEYGSSQPILEIRYDDSPALVSGHTCNTSPAPLSSRYYDTGNRSVGIVADPPLIVWESTTFQYRRNQRTDVCAADVGWHMNRYGNGGEAGQLTLWGHYACSSTPGQTCHPMNELSFNDAVNHHIEDYRNYPTALYGLPSQYYYRFRAFWDVVDNQGFGMAFGCYPVGCISVAQERWQ